ncbi:MAG: glycosyltransferase family 4 protein [Dissulfurispiraceae bacterium]|jgi:glycosyltransferase involved in cell wall biosynthesis|nr:glycosyltransferase family 4 protein [Dissulfurispiraceae bacterium]
MLDERKILVVVRWPLGGIRTYMRYMFSYFPESFKLTLLASSTQEDSALRADVNKYNAGLKLINVDNTIDFIKEIFYELRKIRYDLVVSQGLITFVAVYIANLFIRVPHILTIHGIVEDKYLTGHFKNIKKWILKKMISGVDVLYGVSNDILEHIYEQFPKLRKKGPKPLVILNGIDLNDLDSMPEERIDLRKYFGIDDNTFIFGFFGRFMPQKGFDLLIDAVEKIKSEAPKQRVAVVAVGSGDYIREYRSIINKKGLEEYFYFLPFQPQVNYLYTQVNAVIMPSRWEASGLLAMEVLSLGVPLIASDCIGLRETVENTPTIIFHSESVDGLAEAMFNSIEVDPERFRQYAVEARRRYDVKKSSKAFAEFIEQELLEN